MLDKKRVLVIGIAIIVIVVILVGVYFGIASKKSENQITEYTPQEEIAEEQFRQTIVSLYFVDKESGKLTPEARLIDVKDIISNPYEKLFDILKEGPKNEKLEGVIPKETKILKTYMEKDCLVFDLSKDFLNFELENADKKNNLIYSIVNTLTELTEVNSIKFKIEGQENENLKDVYTRKNVS